MPPTPSKQCKNEPHNTKGSVANYDIVALAASAGGIHTLMTIVEALPKDFPAPIVIVQHIDRRHKSLIADILQRRTKLKVAEAATGETVAPGKIYVAPPDHHLLLTQSGVINLTQSELIHFVRPSADLLFESVAAAYRDRAVAVVLSGFGTDGANGIRAIKSTGGTTFAQDQAPAEMFDMPGAAIATGCVDFVLPLVEIGPSLVTPLMKKDC